MRLCLVLLGVVIAAAARAGDDFTQPIKASPDGRFLTHPDGSPFFFLGENAEYLLWRLNREETELYLKDRAHKGFTVIMAHGVPRSDMNLPNADGQSAFIQGDVTRPNPKYFEHVDWVVARAAHYGLRIALQPINGIEYVAQGKFTASNVEPYGRWLGARYRDKGIIWILGHDTTPIWPQGSWAQGDWQPDKLVLKDYRAVYDRMAQALTLASGHDPFITYHPCGCSFPGTAEPRTSLYWGNREWLDMNLLQSSHFKDPSAFLQKTGLAFAWTATFGYEPFAGSSKHHAIIAHRALLDHGEQITRQAIREAPDGEWSATGAMDNNGISADPVPIKVTVRIQGDELTIDTTGSAPQQVGPTNAPFTATVAFSRLALKRLTTPNYEANEGCFRPLHVVAEPGSIFNATPPAPVFQYYQHAAVMGELLMTALAKAMPEQVVARSGGSECAFLFSGVDSSRGGYFAGAAIDGVGQGASCDADGESALIVYFGGDGRNLPVEVLEERFPILTLRYELRQDSGGPGRFRGGLGVIKEWQALTELQCITVVDQTKFAPQGLFGGHSGLPNVMVLNAGADNESRLGKQSGALLPAAGRWHLLSGGGGGWNNPHDRAPQAVLEDVIQGYVSEESAMRDYGVVLRRSGKRLLIDEAATSALRGQRKVASLVTACSAECNS